MNSIIKDIIKDIYLEFEIKIISENIIHYHYNYNYQYYYQY